LDEVGTSMDIDDEEGRLDGMMDTDKRDSALQDQG
jgi:hypothetical protein